MSKIFDSHCHPNFPQYDTDRDAMLARAFSHDIAMICIGTNLETSRSSVELAQQHDQIWAAIGAHPTDAVGELNVSEYEKLLSEPRVVAIGEIGLDYYRTPEPEKQARQKETFAAFLDLATKYQKPIVIHSRDAGKGSMGRVHPDMLEVLKKYSLTGVAHSFTGTNAEAQQYVDLGYYVGLNGIITFARDYDEMVRAVPLERILIETDAPYLTPVPYRGQRNEPAYVIEVAKKLAELRNEPLERVIEQTTTYCKHLFRIP